MSVQIVKPGGMVSVLAYTKHEGGQEEYEAVRTLAASLCTKTWITSESRMLNRTQAPIMMCFLKR